MTTSSSGIGRLKPPYLAVIAWARVMGTVSGDETAMKLANDVYFGGQPPAPVLIPYNWLRTPVRVRQDNPFTAAEVQITGGETAFNADPEATREWRYDATLDSVAGPDAAILAQWVIDYYDTPRPRLRDLTLRLNSRDTGDLWTILGVEIGTRISITGLPAGFPTGAAELIVEGVRHRMDGAVRDVIWSTTPIIGDQVGQSGPWFRLDQSLLDSTVDRLPA